MLRARASPGRFRHFPHSKHSHSLFAAPRLPSPPQVKTLQLVVANHKEKLDEYLGAFSDADDAASRSTMAVSYTHLRAHETSAHL
eukprot:4107933-Alexandrium_andersonii.AAC.1